MNERAQVQQNAKLSSPTIYEIVANDGKEELMRPASSLFWSGIAAGICMSFSLLSQAYLAAYLPDEKAYDLVIKFGYVFGFVIVILGRLQLFTENTITCILPLLETQTMRAFNKTARLWGLVFFSNMIGTFFIAACIYWYGSMHPGSTDIIVDISKHAFNYPLFELFIRGIPAGFLIAALVWMLPSGGKQKLSLIIMMIYLIALGDFSHVVVGSIESFLLILTQDLTIAQGLLGIGAAGAGNVIGGTGLFAVLAYAQVKGEI